MKEEKREEKGEEKGKEKGEEKGKEKGEEKGEEKGKEKGEEKKEEKDGMTKGILVGIGAALGIAAIGIGGKILYDKYNEEHPKEINEDTDIVIQKLKKQKSIKPKIIKNELDANYIRANLIKEDENEIIKIKNSFICPISKKMMDNPVITPYGTTYEESAILNWIEKNNNDYITKKPLNKNMLAKNLILEATMKEYKQSLIK